MGLLLPPSRMLAFPTLSSEIPTPPSHLQNQCTLTYHAHGSLNFFKVSFGQFGWKLLRQVYLQGRNRWIHNPCPQLCGGAGTRHGETCSMSLSSPFHPMHTLQPWYWKRDVIPILSLWVRLAGLHRSISAATICLPINLNFTLLDLGFLHCCSTLLMVTAFTPGMDGVS